VITDAGAIVLADEVPVDDIPETGYGFTLNDDGITPFVPINRPATANPSVSQTTQCSSSDGALVVLDGTASFDPDGDPLSYRWIGPFGTLTGDVVTTMVPLGSHRIALIVDDGNGGVDSETVEVLVEDSIPPTIVVSASPSTLWPPNNKMVPIAVSVTATDACDTAPRVTLKGITSNEPTKPGDIVVDAQGNISLRATSAGQGSGRVYTITYSAEDASGNTAIGSATVEVLNQPPLANAGADQTVRLGSLVTLDGSNSVDPDQGPSPLIFAWTKAAGPDVALTGADSAKPTFTPTVKGVYTFSLTVNDGQTNSSPDEVTITVPALGDLDGDGDVDQNDVNVVTAARNTPANGPNDLRDINGDLKIDALDARKLVTLCTRPRCAVQ
jgi:hypothetical protein